MKTAILALLLSASTAFAQQYTVVPVPQPPSSQGQWNYYTTGSQSGYVYTAPSQPSNNGTWSLSTDYATGQQSWIHQSNGYTNIYPTTTPKKD